MLQITEGITANIFQMINSLAVEAVQTGREQISDEALESWQPEFDAEAAFDDAGATIPPTPGTVAALH